jgi:SAM-dependent methyltransferase
MPDPLQVANPVQRCKCCGGRAPIFGVVDWVQNLTSIKPELYGIPVYYHRCASCGYLFTVFFDEFTGEDFSKWVYNEQYGLIDLGYGESRARDNTKIIASNFADAKSAHVLDYGGGTGKLAEFLRAEGFVSVDTYDPFVPEFATRPDRKYDLIVSFEVMEHSTKPAEMFADVASFLSPNGMIFFSTTLQPQDILTMGTKWWYLNPRAGHASTYTPQAIHAVVAPMQLSLFCFNHDYHALWRGDFPPFARHLFPAKLRPAPTPA